MKLIKYLPRLAVAGALFATLCLCAKRYIFQSDVKDSVCSTSVRFEDCLSGMATNIWLHEDLARAPYDRILAEIRACTNDGERLSMASQCAERFLALSLDSSDCQRWYRQIENYFTLSWMVAGVLEAGQADDRDRVDFLFAALGKLSHECQAPIPNEKNMEYGEWRMWDNRSMCARSLMVSSLQFVDTHLFDIFLVNIDEELRSGVRKRFDEFHAATTQEVARAEAYRRSHRRSPPPILGPQAQRPQEPHGK